MKRRWIVATAAFSAVAAFFVWRFVRPLSIFAVSDSFARPIAYESLPPEIPSLSATTCRTCHPEYYDEWQTSIHRQAWTEPYFQVDFEFDRSQQICKNCHIPLAVQQEELVLGWRDKARLDPILAPNPDFDAALQLEGVTCAACHLREGRIVATHKGAASPHEVAIIEDANEICFRCHLVIGDRWDTFYKLPPCGTVDEIRATGGVTNCTECHMPYVRRAASPGAQPRDAHQHLWRGGHDPAMVERALRAELEETNGQFVLTVENVGAAHYFPTGTPDRHLTVALRVLDADGNVLREKTRKMKRHVLWRPFIIDLQDTRLPRHVPQTLALSRPSGSEAATVEAVVRYHLLEEARRKRIGYENTTPISYEIYRESIDLRP